VPGRYKPYEPMKTILILSGLILLHLSVKSQNKNDGVLLIDDSKIKPWIAENISEYQSSYHFSQSDLESRLILIIDHDSCSAQIKSGSWTKIDGKDVWMQKTENLKNVKIQGNKFYSSKTNGEFVIFNDEKNKATKGLLVYKPWSSWIFYANIKGQEIGFIIE
jgi:hypothetical protein